MTTVIPASPRGKAATTLSRGQARFAFTTLLIINILNYADRYVLPAVLTKIQQAPNLGGLGLTQSELGLIGSSFLLVYAFATLPLGVWADRSTRKNIVALCVGVWSIATLLTGITRNFIQLFSVRAVLGIGEAGYAPASLSLLGDYFSKERRGRILSYWSAGQLIGAAIGFTIGGLVADAFGWRWAFYAVGIPGLIAAFLAWRMVEPKRGAFEQEGEVEGIEAISTHGRIGKDLWSSAIKLLRIPTYRTLLGAFIFSFFTIGGVSFWLPAYLSKSYHLTVGRAGVISGAVLVGGGILGTVAGGWLADYLQRRHPQGRLVTATFGFLLGAPLALLGIALHDLALSIGVMIVAVMFLSFCTGPLNAVIQDVVVPEVRATAIGLALLLAHLLGDAAAPTVIGFIADKYSLGFALLITAPTFLFLAGLVCLLGLRSVAGDMQRMQEQLLVQGEERQK